jgi:hypothetical protein
MSKKLYHNRLIVPTCAVAASVALCAWLGCQDSSLAKVERERQQSVERTLKALDEREARALKSLLKTQRELDKQLRRDAAALRTDFAELDRRAKDEAERWEKKQPQIKAEVLDRLRGDPERMSETAIQFY